MHGSVRPAPETATVAAPATVDARPLRWHVCAMLTRNTLFATLAVAVLASSAVAAAEPPAAPATPAEPAHPTAHPVRPADLQRPAVPVPAEAPAAPTDKEFAKMASGFRKTAGPGGEPLYCRTEIPIGTMIKKTVCLSRDQIIERARTARDVGDRMNRPVCGANCTPGG